MDHIKSKINKKFKPWITFELTNCCNLKCPMCTVTEKDPLKKGHATVELFNKFLNDLKEDSFFCEDLRIFWVGDPLINPYFNNIIRSIIDNGILNKKLIKRIGFDTNATFLDETKINLLIELGKLIPVHIIFSLDSITKEIYDKIRVGGDFDLVFNNIKKFFYMKAEMKAEFPKAAIQFIVQEKNYNELKDAKNIFEDLFNKLNIEYKIMLNSSFAENDGISFRPLTEQDDNGILQEKANLLFEKFCKEINIISQNEKITNLSQGGGKLEIK